MEKFILRRVAATAFALGTITLLIGGCPSPEGFPEYPLNPLPDYHYVSLTMDSKQATLNYGIPNISNDEPTLVLSPAGDSMRIDARSAGGFLDEQNIAVEFYGSLSVSSPGSYVGQYEGSMSMFTIWERGVYYVYDTLSGAVTISSFGAVGGDVYGTIDITFTAQKIWSPSPTLGPQFRAIGSFRLLRVADSFYF